MYWQEKGGVKTKKKTKQNKTKQNFGGEEIRILKD